MGPGGVPVLNEVMAAGKDNIAAYCAIALGATGDPRIVGAVQSKKKEISVFNTELREAFDLVLRAWASPPDSLIRELQNPNAGLRIIAATALGHLRERRASLPLLSALDDTNPDAFSAKVRAIVKIGDRESVGNLAKKVEGLELERQFLGILALSEGTDPGIPDILTSFQSSPKFQVRMAAGFKRAARSQRPGNREI